MITHRNLNIDGVNISYREAGRPDAPTILLLHGFPSSSHMYRDLMRDLEDRFHLIAPDYPGFGQSDAPSPESFRYTFDNLSLVIERFVEKLGLKKFTLFVQDYGSPVGYRIATRHPDWIRAIIVQNAIAHPDGVTEAFAPIKAFWADPKANEAGARALLAPETTKFQYLQGAAKPERVSPDSWTTDQRGLDRPGNDRIQLALLFDYQNNIARFAEWQSYFQKSQPPMLLVWGKNDPFFSVAGAEAYRRDLPSAELHLLDGGHFALEEHHEAVAGIIRGFADKVVARSKGHGTPASQGPRLTAVEPADADPKAQPLLAAVQKKLGMTPNLMKTLAHSPAALEGYLGLNGALGGGKLAPRIREQIALAVGQANGCQYCVSAHTLLGKMAGLTPAAIQEARQGHAQDAPAAAALAFARRILETRGQVNDGDVAAARAAGLGDAEIAEIVAHVALNVLTNYFNNVARTTVDFPVIQLEAVTS